MSQDELHAIASRDTPSSIEIPNTWQGLIVWALARFGVGIAVAGVFGWGIVHVYSDMRADRIELLEAYRDSISVMQAVSSRLDAQTKAIEDLSNRP